MRSSKTSQKLLKIFDKIDHSVSTNKMTNFSFTENAEMSVRSYLSERNQFVFLSRDRIHNASGDNRCVMVSGTW